MPEKPASSYLMLVEGLNRMVKNDDNPYLCSFGKDFLDQLDHNPAVAAKVNEAFLYREDADRMQGREMVNASYAGNLILRTVHSELFNQPGYPETHRKLGSWSDDIERVVLGDKSEINNFMYEIWIYDVMSNIESRYSIVRTCASRLQERLERPLSVIDLCSGPGHGGKVLAEDIEFAPVNPASSGLGLGDFNERISSKVEYSEVVSVDKANVNREPLVRDWARACSIPPHEMSEERIAVYDKLDRLVVPGTHFILEALGIKAKDTKFMENHPEYRNNTDLVVISAGLYQINARNRPLALRQAKGLLRPGGILLILDHVRVNPNDGYEIEFVDDWYNPAKLPFRAVLYDTEYSEAGYVEIFQCTTGRCKEITVPNLNAQVALERLRHSKK